MLGRAFPTPNIFLLLLQKGQHITPCCALGRGGGPVPAGRWGLTCFGVGELSGMQDGGSGVNDASSQRPPRENERSRSCVKGVYCCGDTPPFTLRAGTGMNHGKIHLWAKQEPPPRPGRLQPPGEAAGMGAAGTGPTAHPRQRLRAG